MKSVIGHIIQFCVDGEKTRFVVDKLEFVVGRSKKSDLIIDNNLLSSRHFKVRFDGKNVYLTDLDSTNGTYYNSVHLTPNQEMKYEYGRKIYIAQKGSIYFQVAQQLGEVKKVVGGNSQVVDSKIVSSKDSAEIIFEKEKMAHLRLVQNELEENRKSLIDEKNSIQLEISKLKSRKEFFLEDVLELEEKLLNLKKEEREVFLKLTEEQESFSDIHNQSLVLSEENQNLKDYLDRQKQKARQIWMDEINSERYIVTDLQKDQEELRAELRKLEDEYLEVMGEKEQLETRVKELSIKVADLEEKHFSLSRDNSNFILEETRLRNSIISLEQEYLKLNEKMIKFHADFDAREAKMNADIKNNLKDSEQTLHAAKKDAEDMIFIAKRDAEHIVDKARRDAERTMRDLTFDKENLEHSIKKLTKDYDHLKASFDKDFKEQVEKIEKETSGMLREAEKKVQILKVEEAERIKKIHDEATKETHELQQEAKNLHQEAKNKFEKAEEEYKRAIEKKEEMLSEIERKISEAEKHVKILYGENEEKIKKMISSAEDNAKMIISESEVFAHKYVKEKEEKADQLVTEAERKSQKLMTDADHYADKTRQETDEMVIKMHKDAEASVQKLHEDVENSTSKLIRDTQNNTSKLIADSEEKAHKIINAADEKAKKLLEEAQNLHNSKMANVNKEVETIKKEKLAHINESIKKEESEYNSKRMLRAQTIGNNISTYLSGELQSLKAKAINDQMINQIVNNTFTLSIDSILEQNSEEAQKLKSMFVTTLKEQGQEEKLKKKMIQSLAPILSLLLIVFIFPEIIVRPREAIISFAKGENRSKEMERLQKEYAEKNKRPVYTPTQTDDFKDSYVDNLLFTKNYLAQKNEKQYNDKWVLDINDFIVYKLDLKDTAVIKYVSAEAKLLRDLQNVQKDIDAENPNVKIQEMHEVEKAYKLKLRDFMEDDIKIKRMYDFNKKHWQEYYQKKSPHL